MHVRYQRHAHAPVTKHARLTHGTRLVSIVVFVFISFTVAAEIDSDEPIGGRLVQ
jgi:hypothetical protein